MKLSKLYNPLMIGLLHSPLHGVVSKIYMVITFAGRVWWRNLQGGAAVTLRVRPAG